MCGIRHNHGNYAVQTKNKLCRSAQLLARLPPTLGNQIRCEMRILVKFGLMSALIAGVVGCSESSGRAAADARAEAADARGNAADAKAEAVREQLLIPSGTVLRILLIDSLGSDTSSAGESFMASLAEPVVIDGATLLPTGTKVRGRVIAAKESGRVKGLATIRLALTDIVQGDRMVAITTNTFTATAQSSKTRDAEVIAGGAGVGAVIGALTGGGKGAGIGALIGGGGGTGVVLATRGKEIRYAAETRLSFTLTNSVQM
jgi:hypothetical protein